ncbi:helix-turn-helix domain-containing protein [Pseudomonas chengduensis]|jgi:excisionase family DNA binding protein
MQSQQTAQAHTTASAVISLNPADLLTPEQAAALLGLSVKTLATWRSTGRHALAFIRCGTRIRYRRSDLDAWLAQRQHTSTAPREVA